MNGWMWIAMIEFCALAVAFLCWNMMKVEADYNEEAWKPPAGR